MKTEVLVINYHQIETGDETELSGISKIYSVSRSAFENQIKVLLENEIPIVTLDDITNNTVISPFSVAITIDDGNLNDYKIIFPFLKKHNIRASFFLPTAKITNWDHITEMSDQGYSIGSHSVTHCNLTKLHVAELKYELEFSKSCIEEKTNQKVLFFSVPFSRYNQNVTNLAMNAGYKAMLTTDFKLNRPGNNSFLIHRWSIKSTTTLNEFKRIILDRKALKRKMLYSALKQMLRKVLGMHASDKLNLLIFKAHMHFNKPKPCI